LICSFPVAPVDEFALTRPVAELAAVELAAVRPDALVAAEREELAPAVPEVEDEAWLEEPLV
jgi:hypothetical protein